MNSIEIPEIGFYKEFAEEPNELTPSQFLFVIKELMSYQSGLQSENDMLTAISFHLLSIRKSVKWFRLNNEQLEIVSDNMSRINEVVRNMFLKQKLGDIEALFLRDGIVRNLIPIIGKYHGPDDLMMNCSFFEYKEAHNAFTQYVNTQDVAFLDRLIAVLYRPKQKFLFIKKLFSGFNGDKRVRFTVKTNPLFLENRVKAIEKLPFFYKYGFFLIYAGFENYLRTGDIEIDGNEISLSALYQNSVSTEDPGLGLTGLLYELSESRVFGNIEETSDTNVFDVIIRLYQLVKISEHLKKVYDKS